PAIRPSTSAVSSTVRVSGPIWSMDHAAGKQPWRETRPHVGRSPTAPQYEAGLRTEPPVSSPRVIEHRPAAAAIPEPEDEPPASWSGLHGLRGWPYGKWMVPPSANSVRLSLPRRMAPAAFSRATTVESADGTFARRSAEPDVVRTPAVSTWSFTAKGTP